MRRDMIAWGDLLRGGWISRGLCFDPLRGRRMYCDIPVAAPPVIDGCPMRGHLSQYDRDYILWAKARPQNLVTYPRLKPWG